MAQNQFSGGYQINEKESQLPDSEGGRQEDLKNIQPGGGVYKAFDEKNITQVDKTHEESDNTINNPDDILGRLDDTPDSHFEENEALNTFIDSPYYPLLEGLLDSGHIDSETFDSTVEDLKNSDKDYEKSVIIYLVGGIEDTDTREAVLDHIEGNNEEVTEDNFEQSEFYSHSKELEIDLDLGVGGLELILANEFYSLPDKSGNTDSRKDLSRTLDIVAKKIVQKNSVDFKQRTSDLVAQIITEKSPSDKYMLLKILFKEDLKTDAKLGGQKAKKEIAQKQKSIKQKAKKIDREMLEIKQQNSSEQNETRLDELKEQKEKLIEEAKDLDNFEGEIFSGSENDKLNEGSETIQETV